MPDSPQRIVGDPDGYEVVFTDSSVCCHKCALHIPAAGEHGVRCAIVEAPCLKDQRPEKRFVHYVKKCSTCGALIQKDEVVHCDGCTKHCVVCQACETGESCEQKEFQE